MSTTVGMSTPKGCTVTARLGTMLITHLEPNQVFVFGSNANANANGNANADGQHGAVPANVILPVSAQ